MSNRTRNIVIIVVVVVALGLIVALSLATSSTASDLSSSLRRRSPVTDYITAEFAHLDCTTKLEDQFLADVAGAIDPTATVEDRQKAAAQVAADGVALSKREELCPTPAAPIFDDDGNLVGYTTTTTNDPAVGG